MKLDDTLLEILTEIQLEFAEKDHNYSIQEIAVIIDSQFVATNLAFKKGLEVRLPIFGTFQRKHGLEMAMAAQELKALEDTLTKDEMESRVLQAKLKNIAKRKKRQKHMTRVTFDMLKATPDKVGVRNKLDKVLKEDNEG